MLPTSEDFVRNTSMGKKKCPRGHLLKKIDIALEVWRQKQNSSLEDQIQALYLVIKRSGSYLRKQEQDTKFGLLMSKTDITTLLMNRKHHAEEVLAAATELLRERAPYRLRGFQYMEQRNQRHKDEMQRLNFNRFTSKSLEPGYDRERLQWLHHEKQYMPHSGTFVSRKNDYQERYGSNEYLMSPQGKTLKDAFLTNFTQLTLEQYEMLGGMEHGLEMGGVVSYYNKIARVEFLVIPNGQGGFETLQGADVNMDYDRFGNADLYMYALDHHGNLLTAPIPDPAQPETDQHDKNFWKRGRFFNHSSFNAGREVICAGCIWIRDGKLKHIDNNSGHYKPTWTNLVEAVSFLRDDGIDLSETQVVDSSHHPTHFRHPYLALSVLDQSFAPYPQHLRELYHLPDR